MIDPTDTLTTALPVTTDSPIRLRFTLDGQVYDVALMQDLLNDWVLVQSWSGKFAARGGGKIVVVTDREDGLSHLRRITRQRLGRGYILLD